MTKNQNDNYDIKELTSESNDVSRHYSFQGNSDLNETQEKFQSMILALNEVFATSLVIINEDKLLLSSVNEIKSFFIANSNVEPENCNDIYQQADQLLAKVIELAILDEDELLRIDNEAMLSIDENPKLEQYVKFKSALEMVQNKYLVTYADS